MQGRASAFDFPLNFDFGGGCNNPGGSDISVLDHASLAGTSPFNAVTSVEDHDTDLQPGASIIRVSTSRSTHLSSAPPLFNLQSYSLSCSCSSSNFEGGGRKRVGKTSASTSTRTSTIGQGGGGSPSLQFFNPTRYRARARPRALKVAGKKGRKDERENEHQDEHDRAGRRGFPPLFNLQSYSLSCSCSSSKL
jgi:hypothetical protein